MVSFTKPGGGIFQVQGGTITRARSVIVGETESELARTRIDWLGGTQFVVEPIGVVGPAIAAELLAFLEFTAPNGYKVWVNAAKAVGPFAHYQKSTSSVKSSFRIMGYTQFVQEDHDTVRDMIKKAGGVVT